MRASGCCKATSKLFSPDPRSSWIGERWEALYQQWKASHEEVCTSGTDENNHLEPERQLMTIVEWCFKKCSALAKCQMDRMKPLLLELAYHLNLKEPLENDRIECTIGNTVEILTKSVSRCQHENELLEIVKKTCEEEYKSDHDDTSEIMLKFISKCTELCWLMQFSDPKLTIEYENLEGTSFDSSRFNQYNIIQYNKIDLVVWPALVMVDNGQVVSKGIVRTVSDGGVTNDNRCREFSDSDDIYREYLPQTHTVEISNELYMEFPQFGNKDNVTVRTTVGLDSPTSDRETR